MGLLIEFNLSYSEKEIAIPNGISDKTESMNYIERLSQYSDQFNYEHFHTTF